MEQDLKYEFNIGYLENKRYVEKCRHNLYKVLKDFTVYGERRLYFNFGDFLLVYDDVLIVIFCDDAEEITNKNLFMLKKIYFTE